MAGSTTQNLCSETSKFEKKQQSSGQFPVGSNVRSLLPQSSPKTYVEGNRRHSIANSEFVNLDQNHTSSRQQQPRKWAQQQQEKKRAVNFGSTHISSPVYGGPKTIESESSPNAVPLKGWPLMGANEVPHLGSQVLNSYWQSSNNQQTIEMQKLHNDQELFAQLLAAAAAVALSPIPISTDPVMLLRNGLNETTAHVSP